MSFDELFFLQLGLALKRSRIEKDRALPCPGSSAELADFFACLAFALTLALVNVDGAIVRQNVARAPQGKGLDVRYLASLSPDAVLALAAAFESPALPGLTRDAVGAVLVCRQHAGSKSADGDWRSFNLSGWRADQDMARLQSRLERYQVTLDQGVLKIITPGHVYYECQ